MNFIYKQSLPGPFYIKKFSLLREKFNSYTSGPRNSLQPPAPNHDSFYELRVPSTISNKQQQSTTEAPLSSAKAKRLEKQFPKAFTKIKVEFCPMPLPTIILVRPTKSSHPFLIDLQMPQPIGCHTSPFPQFFSPLNNLSLFPTNLQYLTRKALLTYPYPPVLSETFMPSADLFNPNLSAHEIDILSKSLFSHIYEYC